MKHHKVKGVWAHKPDALPLGDIPSNGVKRKKSTLQTLSKKHLWDTLKQAHKEVVYDVGRLMEYGMPEAGDTRFAFMVAEWACEAIEDKVGKMEDLVEELEGRMP